LLAALNGDGPLLALDVCNTAAPAIAEEIGARVGVTVWRVSLRNRNPRGTPDTWERDVLQQFASRLAAGEPPATIEASVQTDAGFRYMAAIPMAPLCAQCHGGAIAPEVAARIAALYPQDRATGFTPGELRGAVSVTWPAAR
jgi:cytochrome c553